MGRIMSLLLLYASHDTLWGDLYLYLYNKMKLETLPNKMVQIATLLVSIQDALRSINSWNDYPEDFRGFPQSLQTNRHNRFLPHPLELSKGTDTETRVDINGI
jgi:hypothetical protein